jgi:transposase
LRNICLFLKPFAALVRRVGMSTAAPFSEAIATHNVPLPTPEQLPNDLDTLKRMIVELVTTLQAERRDKENLKHRVKLLLDRLYGPRTERSNPDQLLLFAEWAALADDAAVDSAAVSSEAPPAKPRKRKRITPHGRGQLPDQLPRREVHHQLCEAERLCICGQLRTEIGTDTSERVDWQPASLFVWQDIVHKYLCRACAKKSAEATMTTPAQTTEDQTTTDQTTTGAAADTATPRSPATASPIGPAVISAPKPPAPIAKGLPGAGLLAYIIVSKYFDHLPLYRLEHILKRQGLPLSRSTMCDWMAASAEALRPLYDTMVSQVLQSTWLHTDDTPVKNQGHEPGTTALSRFWIYWGDRTHP